MKRITKLLIVLVPILILLFLFTREVCSSIEDVTAFQPIPIEQRDEQILWIKTFQKKSDVWYQCKPALWRWGFF